MGNVQKSIRLYAWKKNYQSFEIIQDEVLSRTFNVQLMETTAPVNLTNCEVFFYAERPDSKKSYIECQIVSAADGKITVTLTHEIASVAGYVNCFIQVVGHSQTDLRFDGMILEVKDCDLTESAESSDEFPALVDALGKVVPATERANAATAAANQATQRTNQAIQNANSATAAANNATNNANTATKNAEDATSAANVAKNAADRATEGALKAMDDANAAAESANNAYEAAVSAAYELALDELSKRGQIMPEFANDISECTDTSKLYVLPDNFIYYYKKFVEVGGSMYENLVPTSVDTDGSVFNGCGYKENVRLSSSGGISGTAQTGSVTTGFMPFTPGSTIRMKGVEFMDANTKYNGHFYVVFYDKNKNCKQAIDCGQLKNQTGSCSELSYDAATGITTLKMLKGVSSLYGQAVDASSFIRINAYGYGADFIVTLNQEINEAEMVTTYRWANSGHAFVPADYDEVISNLSNSVYKANQKVAMLEQEVSDILDGTTEIAASTKFDPTVYGLPVLYVEGDLSPISVSKDNKVTVNYQYGERSGTCTLKGQGATSYKNAQKLGKYGKYNYTINFDNKFEAVEGWGSQKKYCLKANFIDTTHSRNVVSAKLWGKIVKDRATKNSNLYNLINGGAVDGFPIVMMVNGEFHGVYTMNIPKDGWMFNLKEDSTKQQAFLGANDHLAATQFKGLSAGNDADFELEFVSDENNASWVTPSLNRCIQACIDATASTVDTTVAQYLDWDSAIDYLIFIVVIKGTDMVDKNYLVTTFDGTKWCFTAYDIDSSYGLEWDGSGTTRAVSNVSFDECASAHRVFELIKLYKADQLRARYKQLRSNILSETRICQLFENFAWAIPSPLMIEDVKKWPSIKGSGVNGIDQICRWVRQRLEQTDIWVEKF